MGLRGRAPVGSPEGIGAFLGFYGHPADPNVDAPILLDAEEA